MADALCGPSTALQNFQKHASVDRTLQQDRLVGRHSPSQGFRSSPGPNVGALDHEFEAFQAGHALPPQPQFQHLPHLAHPPPPQFAQPSQAPDWASDFQRMTISQTPHLPQVPQQRLPAQNAAASWHQDFMSQQGASTQTPVFQQNSVGGIGGYSMPSYAHPGFQQPGFGLMNGSPMSQVSQGKQPAQETVPQFDEAAFERAFADVQQAEEQAEEQALEEAMRQQNISKETAREAEPQSDLEVSRPGVYAAEKLKSAALLNITPDIALYFNKLETLEMNNALTSNVKDANFILGTLQRTIDGVSDQAIKTRLERLVRNINERLMSTYPLLSRHPIDQSTTRGDLEADGYTRSPEQLPQSQEPEQKPEQEQHQPNHDDDEMAQTAGRLLERVSDNTSEKFQNSQFLSLMRRLRDREVRVEGDKMVEVSTAQSTSSPPSSAPAQAQVPAQPMPDPIAASIEHYRDISPGMDWSWSDPPSPVPKTVIPPVDPNILDHAATDFDTPVYSGQDHESI